MGVLVCFVFDVLLGCCNEEHGMILEKIKEEVGLVKMTVIVLMFVELTRVLVVVLGIVKIKDN